MTEYSTDYATQEPIQQPEYTIDDGPHVAAPVEYTLISESSQRKGKKLCDSLGFTYVSLYTNFKGVQKWRCAIRNKNIDCNAKVDQLDSNIFIRCSNPHICTPRPGIATTLKMRKKIAETSIPNDFLQTDVLIIDGRHIILAKPNMIRILSQAKNWYIDATFKGVRKPFTQLLIVRAFVKSGESVKQIPLIFAIMCGKRKQDYTEVFKAIDALLPTRNVQTLTLDFEAAMWQAAIDVFPKVLPVGCCFYWSQAVWRKVQELGLQIAYISDKKTHGYIRQLMSLPYLPCDHIGPIFERLQEKAITKPLQELNGYISTTWFENPLWPTSSWSVFGRVIRTHNDVEGWYRCLNQKAKKGQLPFYLLLHLLHEETKCINLDVRLVLENKLTRREELRYRKVQSKVLSIWDNYTYGKISASQLLNACAKLVHVPE